MLRHRAYVATVHDRVVLRAHTLEQGPCGNMAVCVTTWLEAKLDGLGQDKILLCRNSARLALCRDSV